MSPVGKGLKNLRKPMRHGKCWKCCWKGDLFVIKNISFVFNIFKFICCRVINADYTRMRLRNIIHRWIYLLEGIIVPYSILPALTEYQINRKGRKCFSHNDFTLLFHLLQICYSLCYKRSKYGAFNHCNATYFHILTFKP